MPSLSHITNQMLFAGATGNSFHFVKGNYKEILKLKMFGQDTEVKSRNDKFAICSISKGT